MKAVVLRLRRLLTPGLRMQVHLDQQSIKHLTVDSSATWSGAYDQCQQHVSGMIVS